jgi:hypothetical protein
MVMLHFLRSYSRPGSSRGSVFKNQHFLLFVREIWEMLMMGCICRIILNLIIQKFWDFGIKVSE